MSEWTAGMLDDVLIEVDDRNRDGGVETVLSVTEGRGIVPQTEVFKKRIATDDTTKYKVVQPLDIAWNPYLLWTGAVGQWHGHAPGITSPVYPIFRARDGQNARFWGLVLGSGILTPYFDSTAIGSIQRRRRTTLPVFRRAAVSVPPAEDQCRIVDVVTAVDAQIASLTTEVEKVAVVAQCWADESFDQTGGLGMVSVERVTSRVQNGVMYKRGEATGGLPVTRIETMSSGRIDLTRTGEVGLTEDSGAKFLLEAGDILFSNKNSLERVGTTALVDSSHLPLINGDNVLQLRPDGVIPTYLFAMLRSRQVRSRIRSITRPAVNQASVNAGQVRALEIPITDDAAQKQIGERYVDLLAATEQAGRERAYLQALRSTLLTSLLKQDIEIPESYDHLLEAAS